MFLSLLFHVWCFICNHFQLLPHLMGFKQLLVFRESSNTETKFAKVSSRVRKKRQRQSKMSRLSRR